METNFSKGLLPLEHDERDYSHHQAYGTLGASQLPTEDFTIYDPFPYTIKWLDTLSSIAVKFQSTIKEIAELNGIADINKIKTGQTITIPGRPKIILNQRDLDFCAAFSAAEIQHLIFGMEVDPLWQMAKIKQIRGEYMQFGANLRDVAKALVRFGSLISKFAPYTRNGSSTDKDRNFLANWMNYPSNFDVYAARLKDASFFSVDGTYDDFDNIRSALSMHRQERRAVLFGLVWHPEWTEAREGVIPDEMPTSGGEGHAMAIVGQKRIGGAYYLVFQQSWGPTAGDQGFYYFPRDVVNKACKLGYGKFTFSRTDKSGMVGSAIDFVKALLGKIGFK